jgi:hypothetical protein
MHFQSLECNYNNNNNNYYKHIVFLAVKSLTTTIFLSDFSFSTQGKCFAVVVDDVDVGKPFS